MPEPLFIGIDGGGTRCRARLCDAAGRTLGEGTGGPANVRLHPPDVMQSIVAASRQAALAAGLHERDLERAHAGFGLAGAALKSACDALVKEPHPFASVAIETDAYAAWLGAHGGADGAILILGTGTCGLAVVGGRQFYVSGYGAEVSDEASGQMIGREAIRRALWAFDGRAPMTPLAEAMLGRFDRDPEAVIAFVHQARPTDYGSFAPLVFEFAERRDPLALDLITEAAAETERIIRRLIEVGAPSVCLLGGLAAPLAEWLQPQIRVKLSSPKGDALAGAVRMARSGFAETESATARAV